MEFYKCGNCCFHGGLERESNSTMDFVRVLPYTALCLVLKTLKSTKRTRVRFELELTDNYKKRVVKFTCSNFYYCSKFPSYLRVCSAVSNSSADFGIILPTVVYVSYTFVMTSVSRRVHPLAILYNWQAVCINLLIWSTISKQILTILTIISC